MEFELDDNDAEELRKCKDDPHYFYLNYCKIKPKGSDTKMDVKGCESTFKYFMNLCNHNNSNGTNFSSTFLNGRGRGDFMYTDYNSLYNKE
jgi:hypothetical protein